MRTLYLDDQCMAHSQQNEAGTWAPWQDEGGFFMGKCDAFIEGCRVVPEGETWTRADGMVFTGLMIAPVENPAVLWGMQAEADRQTIADLDTAVVDLTYQNILLELEV